MLPWDFERLTPGEFARVAEGWRWREARQLEARREELAWAVSYLANATGMLKRPLRYQQLLVELLGEARVAERMREQAAEDARRKQAPPP